MARRRRASRVFRHPRRSRVPLIRSVTITEVPPGRRQWRPPSRALLLPRAKTVVPDGLDRLRELRELQAVIRAPAHPVVVRRAQVAAVEGRRQLLRMAMPERRTPCQGRQTRREVMFAREVAGKKWSRGSGGPKMDRARHTVESQYTCR